MNCPWCEFEGTPRPLHAHFADAHADQVAFEERAGRTFYGITCPICGDGYSHEINPRGRDPSFAEEFKTQIGLVAFDMLVNHLLVEHDPAAAAGDADETGGEAGEGAVAAPPGPAMGPAWLVEARRKAAEGRPGAST